MKGKLLKSVEAIVALALKRKSVFIDYGPGHKPDIIPAAFVQNYPARSLVNMVKAKYVFTYIKK